MKSYRDLVAECLSKVTELFPWDLQQEFAQGKDVLVVDVREPHEFAMAHIAGSINAPRGILESACDWDYEETIPELATARDREIVVVCRSGNRSILAANVMQQMGYRKVRSLKTGLRGWNDFEQPLVDAHDETVDLDAADVIFSNRVRPEQLRPR